MSYTRRRIFATMDGGNDLPTRVLPKTRSYLYKLALLIESYLSVVRVIFTRQTSDNFYFEIKEQTNNILSSFPGVSPVHVT